VWRDRWFRVGLLGSIVACLACLTPIAALALGAIGLGAWAGHLDVVLLPVLAGFVLLAASRYWMARRRTG
jgi:mercuric ion transport protein